MVSELALVSVEWKILPRFPDSAPDLTLVLSTQTPIILVSEVLNFGGGLSLETYRITKSLHCLSVAAPSHLVTPRLVHHVCLVWRGKPESSLSFFLLFSMSQVKPKHETCVVVTSDISSPVCVIRLCAGFSCHQLRLFVAVSGPCFTKCKYEQAVGAANTSSAARSLSFSSDGKRDECPLNTETFLLYFSPGCCVSHFSFLGGD